MSILTELSVPAAFIIFFLTLGPLKAIGPFAQATRGADPILRRTLAWRATLIATVIVLAVALVGSLILKNWRVSVPAVMIAGGIILFRQAFQMIIESTCFARGSAAGRRPATALPGPGPFPPGHPGPGDGSRHRRHRRLYGHDRRRLEPERHRDLPVAAHHDFEPPGPPERRPDLPVCFPHHSFDSGLGYGGPANRPGNPVYRQCPGASRGAPASRIFGIRSWS